VTERNLNTNDGHDHNPEKPVPGPNLTQLKKEREKDIKNLVKS